ncbi:ABC transporter ATP-binding protein [uncultured Vagococcus sp.]|uniref:ABC transporter ATP-binding protein n=1 Tax=uncultured Vagococcus sp. TaxID=189676 RepID=UPI0028D6388E|nr:ABC transporter ATP-binding protein [uncultured Vagococcus sp.]
MLTIKKLSVTFGQQVALEIDQEIRFEENDRIGIIGSNGAGKSTLINCLLGLVPYKGEIVTNLTHRHMAVHLQENNYSNNVTVKLIMETVLGTKLKDNQELQELVAYFDFNSCLTKRFNKLSGGQKQRLTLILVMLQKAELTFLDEVSSGLDFETRQILMTKLTNWYSQRSGSLCVVSHYYDELEKLTNKLLLLDQGRVVAFGTLEQLFNTYCGYSVITVEDNALTQEFFGGYRQLKAPSQVLALACDNQEDERHIVSQCIRSNINYKRRNNDIEIMTLNAKVAEEVRHE